MPQMGCRQVDEKANIGRIGAAFCIVLSVFDHLFVLSPNRFFRARQHANVWRHLAIANGDVRN